MSNTYWKNKAAKDKASRARAAAHADADYWMRVARNAVASVLPGCDIPSELSSFPVIICNANGTRTVCNYLN